MRQEFCQISIVQRNIYCDIFTVYQGFNQTDLQHFDPPLADRRWHLDPGINVWIENRTVDPVLPESEPDILPLERGLYMCVVTLQRSISCS